MTMILGEHLSIADLRAVENGDHQFGLSEEARKKVKHCYDYLHNKIDSHQAPIYGVTTGFGSLYNKDIDKASLSQLQVNLLRSHACGTGAEVRPEIVRIMLALKVQSLSRGHSGVQTATVDALIRMLNDDIVPVVYEQGSLGASGDLAPLAHLALPLIGEGKVDHKGKRSASHEVFEPMELQAKEGLALINGTQFMSAYGVYSLNRARRLLSLANKIAAISIDAFDGRIEPFYDHSHVIRPHKGQLAIARNIRKSLDGSGLIQREKTHVQDPYSFRCIPQVHGATYDVISTVANVFETEINGVTDNPNIFPDDDMVLSAGNFHGQTLALHLDFLAMAISEIGSISERRIYKLVSGERGLPSFLVAEPGINSGFMIPQYTAASIASRNKQICSPASVDSIVSSNGQEDHVSMGANAAVQCLKVVENVETILAIELMCAAQGLEFRDDQTSPELMEWVRSYRETVPFVSEDTYLHELIKNSLDFIRNNNIPGDSLEW